MSRKLPMRDLFKSTEFEFSIYFRSGCEANQVSVTIATKFELMTSLMALRHRQSRDHVSLGLGAVVRL